MAKRTRTYLPQTVDAVQVLATQIAAARRHRRRTAADVAERAGITTSTLRRIEQGDPTVAIGTVFEVAGLLGVDLFGVEPAELPVLRSRMEDRLALLPRRITATPTDDDEF